MEENYPIADKRSNSAGTAGFVLSLIGLILCWVPILNLILFILGFIFSIVGLCKKNAQKGLAIAGLILAIISAILIVILTAVVGLALLEL